ncbi:MAG TPA: hypothetical protein VF070_09905 [Streptosporangiaceae bacterium]
MSSYPSFNTRVIGQTEKTLNAILNRQLAGTGLTEPQWVILTLAVTGGGTFERDPFARQVAGALKISEAQAQASIDDLIAAQRLRAHDEGSTLIVTDAARQLHSRIRTVVSEITERLWGDLPAEDLATAGRVLSIITERANAELAAAGEL